MKDWGEVVRRRILKFANEVSNSYLLGGFDCFGCISCFRTIYQRISAEFCVSHLSGTTMECCMM
jgi:hypothetical protein